MDITVAQLALNALRLVGQFNLPGRTLSNEEQTEIPTFLNMLLSSWNIMKNKLFCVTDQSFLLTPNTQSYAIGANATAPFNVPRPPWIVRANLIYQTSPTELRLPITLIGVEEWASIRVPQIFAIPLKLYYDLGYTQSAPTGTATLNLWPGPQSAYTLELFTPQLLPENLVIGSTLLVPDGYARALSYNLAREIMPMYKKGMNPATWTLVERIADESRLALENENAIAPIGVIDPALVSKGPRDFNWLVSTN